MSLQPFYGSIEYVNDDISNKLKELDFEYITDYEPSSTTIPESSTKLIIPLTQGKNIVENLENKTIFIPPSNHEVFLSDLTNCTIAVSAQQIRMRRCKDLKLYVYIKGSVLAEQKCSSIVIYPYLFHSTQSERYENQNDKRHYSNVNDLDNPMNPKKCFNINHQTESSFFADIRK